MKLVAIFVLVAAGAVCNFPLTRRYHRILSGYIVVPVIGKSKELLTAQAVPFATNRSHPELSDTLVGLGTVALVLYHRKATVPRIAVGHESLHADALAQVAGRVRCQLCAIFVVGTRLWDHGRGIVAVVLLRAFDDRVARVLEVQEVLQAGTVQVRIVAMGEGIVHDALLVHFARPVEGNGLFDAFFLLTAGDESFLADAHLGRLVAVRVLRVTRTCAADLVRVDIVRGQTLLGVPILPADALAGSVDARGVGKGILEGKRAVRVDGAVQIDEVGFTGPHG